MYNRINEIKLHNDRHIGSTSIAELGWGLTFGLARSSVYRKYSKRIVSEISIVWLFHQTSEIIASD